MFFYSDKHISSATRTRWHAWHELLSFLKQACIATGITSKLPYLDACLLCLISPFPNLPIFFVWCICVVYYLIVSSVVSLFIHCSKLLFFSFFSFILYVFLPTKLFQAAHCGGCVVSFRFFFSVTIHANFDHWLLALSLLNIDLKVAGIFFTAKGAAFWFFSSCNLSDAL